jgi:hypothetical protein
MVEAQGRHDANVVLRSPRDSSVFSSEGFHAAIRNANIQLADPTQMIWDLHQLGGQDRLEAAEVLREWLLQTSP